MRFRCPQRWFSAWRGWWWLAALKISWHHVGGLVACSAILAFIEPLSAANPPSNVDGARRAVASAKAAVLAAEAKLKTVTDHAKEMRQKFDEEFETSPEIVAARRTLEQNKATLEEYKSPLMEKLREQAEYQAAAQRRDEARKILKGKEYSLAILQIKKMESAAIEGHTQANTALAAYADSETKVQELVKKHRDTMLQDPRVAEIRSQIDKAKAALGQARVTMATEQRKLGDAQDKLAQQQRQKQQQQQRHRPPARRR